LLDICDTEDAASKTIGFQFDWVAGGLGGRAVRRERRVMAARMKRVIDDGYIISWPMEQTLKAAGYEVVMADAAAGTSAPSRCALSRPAGGFPAPLRTFSHRAVRIAVTRCYALVRDSYPSVSSELRHLLGSRPRPDAGRQAGFDVRQELSELCQSHD
jgi:hypothetical protein